MIKHWLKEARIIPVLTIHEIDHALPLAEALLAGGLKVLEITLRTDVALDAIREVSSNLPGAIIGAGSVNTPQQLSGVIDAGAVFGVSPGAPVALLDAIDEHRFPFLPGAATPTEMLRLLERGFAIQKLFPATVLGGLDLLRSVAGPIGDVTFCPTGGINQTTASQYLAMDNVIAVGGSWMAPKALVAQERWDEIKQLARKARDVV